MTTELAALVRIEPAHVNMGELATGVFEHGENDVGNVFVNDVLAAALHGDRGGAEQAVGDGDVVRGQRPPGVFVAADGAEVEPVLLEIVHVAEFAGVDHQ